MIDQLGVAVADMDRAEACYISALEPIGIGVLTEVSAEDAFHRAAIAAGGRDNGAPGLRPEYHPNSYGAFALDPDGNNVEAVCHRPG